MEPAEPKEAEEIKKGEEEDKMEGEVEYDEEGKNDDNVVVSTAEGTVDKKIIRNQDSTFLWKTFDWDNEKLRMDPLIR